MVAVNGLKRRAPFATVAVIVLEGERHGRRIGTHLVGRKNLNRESVGAGLGDIDAVGATGEVDWGLGIGDWGLAEGRGVDCDPHEAMSVLGVNASPSVQEPVVVTLRKDRVRLGGESRTDPVFVLSDADIAFRQSW